MSRRSGQPPADPPVAAKATASTAAAKPGVVSALTLPRPAHDITISKDGRIFMMMVDAPALVEWVNGGSAPIPTPGGTTPRPRPQPRAGAAVFAADRAGRAVVGAGHGQPAWTTAAQVGRFDLETNALVAQLSARRRCFHRVVLRRLPVQTDAPSISPTSANGAIVVLHLDTGALRRTLDGDPPPRAPADDRGGQGTAAVFGLGRILDSRHAGGLGDGRWLYYQPAAGPMSRIETRWIDVPQSSDAERGQHVQFWADTQTTGGTAIDAEGNIYASDPDKVQLLKIDPTGTILDFVADPRMLFVDEMWIDEKGSSGCPPSSSTGCCQGGPRPQLPFPGAQGPDGGSGVIGR